MKNAGADADAGCEVDVDGAEIEKSQNFDANQGRASTCSLMKARSQSQGLM